MVEFWFRLSTGRESGGNGGAGLAKFLNQLNVPTLVAVMVMGGGNWLETRSASRLNEREIERAIEEVHQLYPRLNEAIERQKRMQESLNALKVGGDR